MIRSLIAVVLVAPAAAGQGFSPPAAAARMRLPAGFTARVVAAEPVVRQPISMQFDARGRLWVLQYLQYPNPAGLKAVARDQYLRTQWDRVPEPPPRGARGADRLTILSDPDAAGVYRNVVDFVSGLNLASGFCVAPGGVYVVQPPYLLFYPDADEDDTPDADPRVLLTGFGMEDSHSYANSLQFGPDGWLYGAHGSTVSAAVRDPASPESPAVEFQQGIWRYHPKSKRFELFSEGGGNTWGLDFDRHGNAIAGTNWGGFAMLHQMQGAYYVKGFSKHGPLHNPHAYGYLDHVPYRDFRGGHVTCGGVIYQGDAYPAEYQNQYVAGNLLSNAVYWHKLRPAGASFTAMHGGDFLVSNDTWFRPIDLTTGPDGSIYVADWYDKRAAHLDPIDNWDRTNGRVYKIECAGTKPAPEFDLRAKSRAELVALLAHPNAWWRRAARERLAVKLAAPTAQLLRDNVRGADPQLALESLWTLAAAGAADVPFLESLLSHSDEFVRCWAVRLLGDTTGYGPTSAARRAWRDVAAAESSAVVRAQLACTAKRLEPAFARELVRDLARNPHAGNDAELPLLLWWAVEHGAGPADLAGTAVDLVGVSGPADAVAERCVRKLVSLPGGAERVPRVIDAWAAVGRGGVPVRGLAAALAARPRPGAAGELVAAVRRVDRDLPPAAAAEVLARLGDERTLSGLRTVADDPQRPPTERVAALTLLGGAKDAGQKDRLLAVFASASPDTVRVAAAAGLEAFDDAAVWPALVGGYSKRPGAVNRRAVQALVARSGGAKALFAALETGAVPPADVSVEQVRAALAFGDAGVAKTAARLYGKVGPPTPGEKQARISWLGVALGRGAGSVEAGRPLYAKHCAACHTLHGVGNKIGPDLTTADRKNRGGLLASIVDPSAYVRPEYVAHAANLKDGRKLVGLVVESSAEAVTLLDAENRKTVVPRADMDDLTPSPRSLMPEQLLDGLTDQQVCDLFAFLAADPPPKK